MEYLFASPDDDASEELPKELEQEVLEEELDEDEEDDETELEEGDSSEKTTDNDE